MEQPKQINNTSERLVDDLKSRLSTQSRISIAAACQLMRQELGSDYDTGTYAWLSERYSDGVPRDVVQRLIDGRRQALQASAAESACSSSCFTARCNSTTHASMSCTEPAGQVSERMNGGAWRATRPQRFPFRFEEKE